MKSFRQLVTEAVLAGATTSIEVLTAVGPNISAASAANAYRRDCRLRCNRGEKVPKRSTHDGILVGKRRLVNETMASLAKLGKIIRVSYGVYGPPLPKLYVQEQSA